VPVLWLVRQAVVQGRRLGAALNAARTQRAAPDYPDARLGGWVQNSIVLFFVLYLIGWNLRTLDTSSHHTSYGRFFPPQLNGLGWALGLDQSWGLFAPKPGGVDGWYIIPAVLKNGRVVDLYQDGAELTDKKPESVSSTYSNTRARKYYMNMTAPDFEYLRYPFASYMIRSWNSTHGEDEQIERMYVLFMLKITNPEHQVDRFDEQRLFTWPGYPEAALAGAFGEVAPPVVYELKTRDNHPVLPELMRMKDKR
jgi:hypothetical protein